MAVDDHPVLRQGLSAIIANELDMQLVGEAANGREALEQYRVLEPDIVLLDVQMPEMNGIEAIRAIRAEFPTARVIVLTTFAGDVLAQTALEAGAQGYILKGSLRKELLDTVRAVYRGQKRVNAAVAKKMATYVGADALSEREINVLKLIALGNPNKRIGFHLAITEETVKAHVKSILSKLGANDRTHAVTLGVMRGIIQL